MLGIGAKLFEELYLFAMAGFILPILSGCSFLCFADPVC